MKICWCWLKLLVCNVLAQLHVKEPFLIKSKFRNKLGTKNLDSLLRIALEGPKEGAKGILIEAVALWKNSTKFRYLFSNPQFSNPLKK